MNPLSFLDGLFDEVEVEWRSLKDLLVRCSLSKIKTEPYIIVKPHGIVKFYYYHDRPFVRKGHRWLYRPKDSKINIKYIYYYLQLNTFYFQHFASKTETLKIPVEVINEFKIPIPCPNNPKKSLAIQSKLVEILDHFTELTEELTKELTLRKKQYRYYRNQLLSFDENCVEVEMKTLGSIGEVRMCKRILKNQTSAIGDIPFFKIRTFGKTPDSYISRDIFEKYREKYNYPKVGQVLISASGTIGKAVIFDGKEAYFQDSNIIWIENDEAKVLNKYLFYFYQIANWNISDGGVIKRLYNQNIKKTLIPIPYPNNPSQSLAEQARIVAILDQFDQLTHSLEEGLPHAIELGKKQYEYYRDLLFDFFKV